MGCGGSKVYAEDGSITPGKGEADIAMNEKEFFAGLAIWGGKENCHVEFKRVTANPKELFLAPWDRRSAYEAQEHWFDMEPGTYFWRFVVNHKRIAFPGGMCLDLPKKLYAVHAIDPTILPKVLVVTAKAMKGHAYQAADGEELARKDMDELDTLVSAHQMSDNLSLLKSVLVMLEDNMPYNTASLSCNIKIDHGYWEAGERKLGVADKIKIKADELQNSPLTIRKIRYEVDKVMRDGLRKSVETGLSKFKLSLEQLVPTFDDLMDIAAGRRPGCTKAGTAKVPVNPKPDDDAAVKAREDARLANDLYVWERDKPLLAEYASNDKDVRKCRDHIEVAMGAQIRDVLNNMDKKLTARDLEPGTIVIARFNKTSYFYEAKIIDKFSDTDYSIEFPETPDEFVWNERMPEKNEKGEPNFISMPPPASKDNLAVGTKVTAIRSDDPKYYYKGRVQTVNRDGTYDIVDEVNDVERNKVIEQLWLSATLSDICGKLKIEGRNFVKVTFKFVVNTPEKKAKLRVWREAEKDGSMEELEGVEQRAPLKPTKKVPNPAGDCFLGWHFDVNMLPNRYYCYQFLLDEVVYLDWDKPSQDPNAFKRLSLTVSL